MRGRLPVETSREMDEVCRETGNRQMIDLAAQEAGKHGDLDLSAALFERALEIDPEAVKTRLGLLTTLHLQSRFEDEIPLIKALLEIIPNEPTLHRFAIQAGKWGGDMDLARRGLELVRQHDPRAAEAATRFLNADIPPPRRMPRAPQ